MIANCAKVSDLLVLEANVCVCTFLCIYTHKYDLEPLKLEISCGLCMLLRPTCFLGACLQPESSA